MSTIAFTLLWNVALATGQKAKNLSMWKGSKTPTAHRGMNHPSTQAID